MSVNDWKTEKEEEEIKERTGLGIGVVKISGEPFENNICRYDCVSANFHLLPRLDIERAEDEVNDYLKVVEGIQDEIYKKIASEYNLKNGKGKGNGTISDRAYPAEYSDHGIPNKREYGFYKYISIYEGQRWYTINFMRWYIDKENKVNCRFGEIQFDTTMNKEKRVNTAQFERKGKKDIIRYPKSYRGQSEKMIRLDGEDQVCIYNPTDVDDIWHIQKKEVYANNVVESFVKFIEKVKGEGK